MKISGWGCYPITDAKVFYPQTANHYSKLIEQGELIARGRGRSYGDSANYGRVAQSDYFTHYIQFDRIKGILKCEAGVTISNLLTQIIPEGWFVPVSPGTSQVTIGGAIASDVHGKNHHVHGTFTQHILELDLMLGTGEIKTISPLVNSDLFHATCGGMGLTGIILNATIQLIPIQSSLINQTTLKAKNLDEVYEQFTLNASSTYSVAWIDCLSTGKNLGRSLLILGEHASEGGLNLSLNQSLSTPFNLPNIVLNKYSIKAFNALYYQKNITKIQKITLPLTKYFYPLDSISDWNRLYGKAGFFQYQFVIPKSTNTEGLRSIFKFIANSGMGSFLAVLKSFGPANQNLLSFPEEGFTLALDFKVNPETLKLASTLDKMVIDYGGRLYLAKDALMTPQTFRQMYPRWGEFQRIRERCGALGKFKSHQSIRLGLD